MKLECVWTQSAEDDRHYIWYLYEQSNYEEACRVDRLIESAAELICSNPHVGTRGQIPGTREVMPEPNCRLIYELSHHGRIIILAVIHSAFVAAGRW